MSTWPVAPRVWAPICGLALSWALSGCGEPNNLGVPPPSDSIFFPSGLMLDADPARAVDGRSRWLVVANGNNDLAFNSGTLVAFDLEAFWAAWFDESTGTVYPYCDGDGSGDDVQRCVLPPATPTTAQRPCRRLALSPSIVECDERPFALEDQTVRLGDFSTTIAASSENGLTRLWIPVRGDPSLTFVDIPEGPSLTMSCGQGSDPIDERQCGEAFKLDRERNDESLTPLAREPSNVLISDDPRQRERLAFVSHSDGRNMTVVALDGVSGRGGPAIVYEGSLYTDNENGLGSFGIVQRPCFDVGQGPNGDADPDANLPAVTEDCTRPLIYTSLRRVDRLTSFTASSARPPAVAEVITAADRDDCFAQLPVSCDGDLRCDAAAGVCDTEPCEQVYAGQYCAAPDQIGQPCAVECVPQIRAARRLTVGALPEDPGLQTINVLGDIAFADARGDKLLIVQTNPGALLQLDTSLDDNGDPLDIPAGPPIELCAEPSRMKLYEDAGQRFALVSCFASALVYVVDLEAARVINQVVVGTGPHELVIDEAREVLYVANTLEASISVVDLSRRRPTRFEEIARLGLQEPFSQ